MRSRTALARQETKNATFAFMADNRHIDHRSFPETRYQGSKRKLLDWLWDGLQQLSFDTVLDPFGGTGAVSYLLKAQGKEVIYNDYLRSNYLIGKGLIENAATRLEESEIAALFRRQPGRAYDNFIERTFRSIYYLDEENKWLDVVAQNISSLSNSYKRALAYFSLAQACMAKRPYNLFHRANLYMRTSGVRRSFGNKTTWDRPFAEHFTQAAREANLAVFSNGRNNRALHVDVSRLSERADLAYLDPPYLNRRGVGVDYLEFYHFLEGLVDYNQWPERIDYLRKHRPFMHQPNAWSDRKTFSKAFGDLLDIIGPCPVALSYRDNGLPTEDELLHLLRRHRNSVRVIAKTSYKYVLSPSPVKELLFIAE